MCLFYLLRQLLGHLVRGLVLAPSDARACEFVDVKADRCSLRSFCEVTPGDLFAPALIIYRRAVLNSVDFLKI